ncbi:hypothetical protein Bca52824_046224 [Brassica carinata]|uniref:Uncharacterized protein n=1 Tax=Brassica carinata TaxID=52824 RepID=A0A8X7UNU5_BRACI|nr:hypothetical protein Bca52824_046224 [Brassica carinata]
MTYPLHALTGYCPSLQAGLSRHWEHIISFTAEGLIQETTIADEIAESLFVDFNGKNAYLVLTKVDTDGDDCEEAPTIGITSTGVHTNKPPATATSKVGKKARVA